MCEEILKFKRTLSSKKYTEVYINRLWMLAVRATENPKECTVLAKEIGELIHFLLVFHDLQLQYRLALSWVMGHVQTGDNFEENGNVDFE